MHLRLRTFGISGNFRLFLSIHPGGGIVGCTLICVVSNAFTIVSSSLTPHPLLPFTRYLLLRSKFPTLFNGPPSSYFLANSLLHIFCVVAVFFIILAFVTKVVAAVAGNTKIFVVDCLSISGDLSSSKSDESDFDDGYSSSRPGTSLMIIKFMSMW